MSLGHDGTGGRAPGGRAMSLGHDGTGGPAPGGRAMSLGHDGTGGRAAGRSAAPCIGRPVGRVGDATAT
jgi:hypothetical protein